MILEQDAALLLQRGLDPGEHAEHAREEHLNAPLSITSMSPRSPRPSPPLQVSCLAPSRLTCAPPGICSSSFGCCRRFGAAPRPCRGCGAGRCRWADPTLRRRPPSALFKQRGLSIIRHAVPWPCLHPGSAAGAARRRPAAGCRWSAGLGSRRRLYHRRPGRARLPHLVPRGAGGRRRSSRSTIISRRGGRGIVPTWSCSHRHVVGGCGAQPFEVPPTRNGRTSPYPALYPRLCRPGWPGRAGLSYRNPALNCARAEPKRP